MHQIDINKQIDSQDRILVLIIKAISGIKFGEVVIKIQDGRVIQIERIEKFRLDRLADSKSGKAKF